MSQSSATYRSHCPINFVLESFGDKWSLLIIRDLMFKNKHQFGDFLKSHENISTNILADRLRKLESCGIITVKKDPKHGSVKLYHLTPKGIDLVPLMLEISAWSGKYDSLTNAPSELLSAIEKDKSQVIQAIQTNLLSKA